MKNIDQLLLRSQMLPACQAASIRLFKAWRAGRYPPSSAEAVSEGG